MRVRKGSDFWQYLTLVLKQLPYLYLIDSDEEVDQLQFVLKILSSDEIKDFISNFECFKQ